MYPDGRRRRGGVSMTAVHQIMYPGAAGETWHCYVRGDLGTAAARAGAGSPGAHAGVGLWGFGEEDRVWIRRKKIKEWKERKRREIRKRNEKTRKSGGSVGRGGVTTAQRDSKQ
jgi:hypothetical protein